MKRKLSALVTSVACGVGLLTAVGGLAAPAGAAPAACTATDAAIYTNPPATTPGGAGTLIRCSTTTLPQVPAKVPYKAWKVQYVSTNVKGTRVPTTGTVIVPTNAWKGTGTRPLVAFAPGTLGLGAQCAFSKQIAGKFQDEYEGDNLAALLAAGFAVSATDGQGYVGSAIHPYVSGFSAGHAILDGARTAFQVPGSGLSKTTKVGLWGYSEGGQTALWGAQLAASYAPDLKVAGVAAGGVPGDLKLVASQLNGGPFAGFLADAVVGLTADYPELPFTSLLNDAGRTAVAKAKTLCLLGTLSSFPFANLSSFTTAGLTLDQIYALKGTNGVTWGQTLDSLALGVNVGPATSAAKYKVGFPTFQYRGIAEEIINTKAEDGTRAAYCKAGITTQWNPNYLGDHLLTDSAAINDAVTWFGDRFAGKATSGNC